MVNVLVVFLRRSVGAFCVARGDCPAGLLDAVLLLVALVLFAVLAVIVAFLLIFHGLLVHAAPGGEKFDPSQF